VNVTTPRGTSFPVNFTVTNGGPYTLTGAPTITADSGTGVFTVTGGTCVSGFTLSATPGHTTCTITVHYVPPAAPAAVASTANVTLSFPKTTANSNVFNAN
jgi:hypothetical protein